MLDGQAPLLVDDGHAVGVERVGPEDVFEEDQLGVDLVDEGPVLVGLVAQDGADQVDSAGTRRLDQREVTDQHLHQVGGHRVSDLPHPRAVVAVGGTRGGDAVGHGDGPGGRRDAEAPGGLVRRVVNRRQPVPPGFRLVQGVGVAVGSDPAGPELVGLGSDLRVVGVGHGQLEAGAGGDHLVGGDQQLGLVVGDVDLVAVEGHSLDGERSCVDGHPRQVRGGSDGHGHRPRRRQLVVDDELDVVVGDVEPRRAEVRVERVLDAGGQGRDVLEPGPRGRDRLGGRRRCGGGERVGRLLVLASRGARTGAQQRDGRDRHRHSPAPSTSRPATGGTARPDVDWPWPATSSRHQDAAGVAAEASPPSSRRHHEVRRGQARQPETSEASSSSTRPSAWRAKRPRPASWTGSSSAHGHPPNSVRR